MTFEAVHDGAVARRVSVASSPTPGWFKENRAVIIRHAVINLFMVIIILPLLWVLLMSVKSRPDAMQGRFWPTKWDFTRYQ